MDVTLVNDEIVLEPDVAGRVLVDVLNTEDVIDAVEVDVRGVPGATASLDATPTLFPGERRRLPLKVLLPSRVAAGRHRLDVLVRSSGAGTSRQADLTVEVRPRPGLTSVVRPSVLRARRRAVFPVTVVNRGNTLLSLEFRDLDVPDGVGVTLDLDEDVVPPWRTTVCEATVRVPLMLVGAVREHAVDLRVSAWSSAPGQPLLEEELTEDVRLVLRQRPLVSLTTLFILGLIVVLLVWGTLGYLGLRAFVRVEAAPLEMSDVFRPDSPIAAQDRSRSDTTVTISGTVTSEVDRAPLPRAQVRACDRDPLITSCSATVYSDDHGKFSLPGLFPGPYRLKFSSPETGTRWFDSNWYTTSCSVTASLPSRPGTLIGKVGLPKTGTETLTELTVVATVAEPDPPTGPSPSASPTVDGLPRTGACPVSDSPVPGAGPTGEIGSFTSGSVAGEPVYQAEVPLTRNVDRSLTSGRFVLADLPAPGRYVLTIRAGRHCMSMNPITVSPDGGEELDLREITFRDTPDIGECKL